MTIGSSLVNLIIFLQLKYILPSVVKTIDDDTTHKAHPEFGLRDLTLHALADLVYTLDGGSNLNECTHFTSVSLHVVCSMHILAQLAKLSR